MGTWRRPTPLESRHEVAVELLRRGEVDVDERPLLLAAVVWPPAELEPARRRAAWPPEVADEARRLYREEGLSVPQIAERLAVPFGTAKGWIFKEGRHRKRRPLDAAA